MGASVSKADIDNLANQYQQKGNYALASHKHDDVYQPKGDYALATHNHNDLYQPKGDYALSSHNHNDLYAPKVHNHNELYSTLSHNHNDVYAPKVHNHDDLYSLKTHNHNDLYQPKGEYALKTDMQNVQTMLGSADTPPFINDKLRSVYSPTLCLNQKTDNTLNLTACANASSFSYDPVMKRIRTTTAPAKCLTAETNNNNLTFSDCLNLPKQQFTYNAAGEVKYIGPKDTVDFDNRRHLIAGSTDFKEGQVVHLWNQDTAKPQIHQFNLLNASQKARIELANKENEITRLRLIELAKDYKSPILASRDYYNQRLAFIKSQYGELTDVVAQAVKLSSLIPTESPVANCSLITLANSSGDMWCKTEKGQGASLLRVDTAGCPTLQGKAICRVPPSGI